MKMFSIGLLLLLSSFTIAQTHYGVVIDGADTLLSASKQNALTPLYNFSPILINAIMINKIEEKDVIQFILSQDTVRAFVVDSLSAATFFETDNYQLPDLKNKTSWKEFFYAHQYKYKITYSIKKKGIDLIFSREKSELNAKIYSGELTLILIGIFTLVGFVIQFYFIGLLEIPAGYCYFITLVIGIFSVPFINSILVLFSNIFGAWIAVYFVRKIKRD